MVPPVAGRLTVFGHLANAGHSPKSATNLAFALNGPPLCPFAVDMQPLGFGRRIALTCSKEQQMPLLNIVVMLIVVGVALYVINRYIPMASSIKSILNVVVVVVVCVWLLQAAGLWTNVSHFRLTR
jgi:hypothetical protein